MTSVSSESTQGYQTFTYKEADCGSIQLDVYPPSLEPYSAYDGDSPPTVPAVIFFHGGGFTVGDRRSWFPDWFKERATAAGLTFISADYRLLPPSTGHDLVDDLQDLFRFLATDLNKLLRTASDPNAPPFQIDTAALAVSGSSAGGLCAYLAVMHASPKPKALLALYAMGGNFLIPHYFSPKSGVFFRGREVLEPEDFSEFLYPQCTQLQSTSGSELAYHGPDFRIPGFPANPRMLLPRLYLQLGVWLDYYTGEHEPSLSEALRAAADEGVDLRVCVQSGQTKLFPHLNVDSSWPPTFLLHGSADTAVPVEESKSLRELLLQADIDVTLRVLDGQEHSFDKAPGADEAFGGPGGLFDEVRNFLLKQMRS